MNYAVVRLANKQYTVYENSTVEIDRLSKEKDQPVTFDEVLLIVANGTTKVGTPTVSGAKVLAKVLGEVKSDKVRVSKFKSKVRFRRVTGFRAKKTKILIEKIDLLGKVDKKEAGEEKTQPKIRSTKNNLI